MALQDVIEQFNERVKDTRYNHRQAPAGMSQKDLVLHIADLIDDLHTLESDLRMDLQILLADARKC
jgi:hypothetical protein